MNKIKIRCIVQSFHLWYTTGYYGKKFPYFGRTFLRFIYIDGTKHYLYSKVNGYIGNAARCGLFAVSRTVPVLT